MNDIKTPTEIELSHKNRVKPPFKLKEVWSIRFLLKQAKKTKELALFDMAVDSKLRGCDLIKMRVSDVAIGRDVFTRATVIQQKTGRPVRFELTRDTRRAVRDWIVEAGLTSADYLFPSRIKASPHISTRQYTRIVKSWAASIGLNPAEYGTHSLRRTKVTIIYRQTRNLRAIQLLLGHAKLESTVRYLGVEVEDALDLAEQIDV